MVALPYSLCATDYYIKNDLGQPANLRIACNDRSEVIAIASGDVAYFKTNKCSKAPLVTVTAVGVLPNSALKNASSILLSQSTLRLYVDKQKMVAFELSAIVPEDAIQNYRLDL